MHSPSPRTSGSLVLLFASSLLWGCQLAPQGKNWPVPSEPWSDLDQEASPSLEQIFLDPPLQGKPPSVAAISADGLWLLTRWEDPEAGDEDEQPAGEVRLLSTQAEAPGNGVPINDALGLEDEAAKARGPWTWSFEGATLAIARGRNVYLFEPSHGERRLFLQGPGKPIEEATADEDEAASEETGDEEVGEEQASEEAPAKEQPKLPEFRIQSLAFAPDGESLRAFINDHLYVFPLDDEQRTEPLGLADGQCLSEGITSNRRMDWSDDLQVVFGKGPFPMPEPEQDQAGQQEQGTDDGSAQDQETEEPEKTQIWRVAEQTGVALEGMQDLRWLESTSLSKDGRFVYGVSYDRRAEPDRVHVPNYLTERVTTQRGRRLLAEDGPSHFEQFIWDTKTGARSPLLGPDERRDWDAHAPEEHGGQRQEGDWWLRNIGWAPQKSPGAPARFAFERISADYHHLELYVWSEGEIQLVWRDYDERWLGGPARFSMWSSDGSRLLVGSEWGLAPGFDSRASAPGDADFVSNTPGKCQLFAIDPASAEVIQLTHFEGELTRFFSLPNGGVVVNGSESNVAQRVAGVISPGALLGEEPPAPEIAPLPPGWNVSLRSSSDGSRLVFSHSELMQPAELWVHGAAGSRQLTRATPASFKRFDWIKPARLSVQSADGQEVWAHVYLPKGMSLDNPAGPRRAAIVFVHGAGYLQNVTDSMTRYEPNMLFHSRLAQLGYPVIDVDYRGSAGYGSRFRSDVQYHLGGLDLDDIHLVVDELSRRGLVDRQRMGLYGGSYGGFMAMMALFTAPERWAAGAALRSVTDWRTYHPTYTQPRLGRPSTHAEAYAKSSPIDLYENLEDPLLILHGMMDDNVFAQDSIRLIEALIDQGSDFEAMLYPSQRHGFTDGAHWLDEYRRIERFLLRHLGPPLPSN